MIQFMLSWELLIAFAVMAGVPLKVKIGRFAKKLLHLVVNLCNAGIILPDKI
jgi:hypothetical protein